MPAKVTLKVTQGKHTGQEFVFPERTTCIVGREEDCQPKLPTDKDHQTISRHHCLLDINPPDIRVRDFGSLNGTHVNGIKIGQREKGMTPEQGAQMTFPEHDLKGGDEIKLGKTVFQVDIFSPVYCAECSDEISEEQKVQALRGPDVYQCERCRKKAEATKIKAPPKPKPRRCGKCGREVAGETGTNRHGDFVCTACKGDPIGIVQFLLGLAKSGDNDLVVLKGYEVVRELGRGGFGAVCLARHTKTGEQVALKVMLPKVAMDHHAKERFLREVEYTKALRHVNVVAARDSGCANGSFFFTLEYCDGGSVDQLMKGRGGTLSIDDAGPIILGALDGLDYAHTVELNVRLADGTYSQARGLVHRDLSPHNLLLAGSGNSRVAKVADFGLAKAFDLAGLSGHTRTGNAGGKAGFMPRQQLINFKYSKPEVDVWAIAACLYNMLTGFAPRHFPPDKDPWLTVVQDPAIPIRQRNAFIPKRLADVIDYALVDRPQIQFKTAAEFKNALKGVL